MKKEILKIALAYVGVIVGGGLSSGQDIMQYFIHFGINGFWGIVLLCLLNMLFGKIILTLGSYYQSNNHHDVLQNIAHPLIQKVIDFSLIAACFCIGFVMIAGAGANLEQQFMIPRWLGCLLCVGSMFVVSYLDFKKITDIFAICTPIIIVMLIGIGIYSLFHIDIDIDTLNTLAAQIPSSMPSLLSSVINYFSVCAMTGVSMAFVLGGSVLRIGFAKKSGMLGGLCIGLIILCAAVSLYVNLPNVLQSEIPMLTIVEEISPLLSNIYAWIIFFMIFNTAFALFYALAKRFDKGSEKRMHLVFNFTVLLGYVCSFGGFKYLIGTVYPLLGYFGFVLLITLAYAWLKEKNIIVKEMKVRLQMMRIMQKKFKEDTEYTQNDKKQFHLLSQKSIVETDTIQNEVQKYVKNVIENE